MRTRFKVKSWAMAVGAAVGLFSGLAAAQTSDTNPPLIWTAREWLHSHANADDEGVDIVYWNEDPQGTNKHWVYSAGWVTALNLNNSVRGTKFATYQYNAASNGTSGDLNPTNTAYFPGLGIGINQGDTYKAVAMTVDPDNGDIYVTGEGPHTPGAVNNQDYYVVKYNASLAQQWSAQYEGGHGNDIPADIGLSNGETVVVVTGTSPGDGTGEDIATVAWLTSNGARAVDPLNADNYWPDIGWGDGVRRYNNDAEDGDDTAVELGPISIVELDYPTIVLEAVVLGTSWGGATYNDFTTHRWSTVASADSEVRFDQGLNDVATGLAHDSAGYIWCVGYSEFPYQGDTPDYNNDYAIQSVNLDYPLSERWNRSWDYAGYDDYPADITVKNLGNGNFDVWATGKGYNGTKYNATTVYYFDDGTPSASPDYSVGFAAGSTFNYGKAIALGTATPFLPYLTGSVGSGGTDYMFGLKYQVDNSPPPPFQQHWQKFYNNGGFDEGRAITVQSVGNTGSNMSVYIVGTSASTSNGRDFCTWRYKE